MTTLNSSHVFPRENENVVADLNEMLIILISEAAAKKRPK